MRVVLVNDTGGRDNIGCRLTSATLARALRDAFAARGVAIDLRSAPWGFAPRLPLRGAARRALGSEGALSAAPLRALAAAEYGEAAVADCEGADAVVFQPEGTISDDHGALRVLRLLSLPLYAALHAGRPLAVTNGTFPLGRDARAPLVELLLGRAAHAALRDRPSAERWGAAFAPDTAVLWPGEAPVPAPAQALAPAPADHLLVTTAAEAGRARNLALGRLALDLCRQEGLRPLVLTKGASALVPLRAEVERMGGAFVAEATLAEADAWVGRCRLHVGGRYHMALLAATKGVPSALVRSNTHKNLWLAAEFDGIAAAPSDAALADAARSLLAGPTPRPGLLADVARCRALLRADMGRLCGALLSAPGAAARAAPRLDEATAAAIAREAAAEGGWTGRLRRALPRLPGP